MTPLLNDPDDRSPHAAPPPSDNVPTSSQTRGRVAVVGLGYVGTVTAAKLAQRGWSVHGVESNRVKLDWLAQGRPPVREPGLAPLLSQVIKSNNFHASDDLPAAVHAADLVIVCVGTPGTPTGKADLTAVRRVIDKIAQTIARLHHPPVILIRSTLPPGTCQHEIAPILQAAHRQVVVAHHPEFLREASALADWDHPPLLVFGAPPHHRHAMETLVKKIYEPVDAPTILCDWTESELIKLSANAFHALKTTFANEIGALAQSCGADGRAVMAALCKDHRLNISSAYLTPGFCFGGSCLPKDTRALQAHAIEAGLDTPLIGSILDANHAHLDRFVRHILAQGRQPTLLVGLTFKPGTDDLRQSPMVELAERLLGKGVPLTIFDPDLLPNELVGANAAYIRQHLPHLHLLLRNDPASCLAATERVILAKPLPEDLYPLLAGKTLVNLTTTPQPGMVNKTDQYLAVRQPARAPLSSPRRAA